jgi:hypothetical protein
MVPDLAAPEFAATLKVVLPLPLPDADCGIVIQPALLVAVHPQPEAARTLSVPEAAFAPNEVLLAVAVYVQAGALVIVSASVGVFWYSPTSAVNV